MEILEKLSFFSPEGTMYRVLVDEFGEASAKQKFIKDNIAFLTTDEGIAFHMTSTRYYDTTIKIPVAITAACTIAAFFIGLWRLPSRKSTLKYSLWGMTGGVVVSYGTWRYSMFSYYNKINELFKTIIR